MIPRDVEVERRRSEEPEHQKFVPALGLIVLNPLFDSLVRLVMREREFKDRPVDQLAIQTGFWTLDVGSGTGTLALMVKECDPERPDAGGQVARRNLALRKTWTNQATNHAPAEKMSSSRWLSDFSPHPAHTWHLLRGQYIRAGSGSTRAG